MPGRRSRFVRLTELLTQRGVDDPVACIQEGRVIVEGSVTTNPTARVRSDSAIKVRPRGALRGASKLRVGLGAFGMTRLDGLIAVDVGAAAGGFTQALLEAGASRVYAVDVGVGQLRGWLRADPRVVDLERTNLAALDETLVPDIVDLVTMDLSYLSLSDAVPQLAHVRLRRGARLLALVKPTFELHAGSLAADPAHVAAATTMVRAVLLEHAWEDIAFTEARVHGSRGAVETFVLARRP